MDGSRKFTGPFQAKPTYKWIEIENLGTLNGGLNGGIVKVRRADDYSGTIYIEKRYTAEHVIEGFAKKEIALLWQVCNHKYIVKLIDYFLDDNRKKASVYLEYCDQGSLDDYIRSRNGVSYVAEEQVWEWFLHTMKALYFCQCGPHPDNASARRKWERIWHRDLKPANILLTRHHKDVGRTIAKIADFGLATSKSWSYEAFKRGKKVWNASGGTRGFDPPEFPERFTGRSDLWQLALCIVCLCNLIRYPRSRDNPNGSRWSKEQPAGHRYSRELNNVLKFCLVEDMEQRPQVEAALARLEQGYERFKNSAYLKHPQLGPSRQPETPERQPLSSPGQRNYFHRPGFPARVFSDSAIPRIDGRDNRYMEYVHGQRYPDPMHGLYPGPMHGFHPYGHWEEEEYEDNERCVRPGFYPVLHPELMTNTRYYDHLNPWFE